MINSQLEKVIDISKFKHLSKTGNAKKCLKELPENFFERVLDLELKIKKEFSMDILEEIILLYSLAIEYYESIENPRFRDYQTKLNLLLTQPEIIKKMGNPLYREKKSNYKIEDLEKKRKLDQAKKDLKMKINYKSRIKNISNNETEIRNLLKNYKKNENPQGLIDNDLQKQESNFQSRLQERRRTKNGVDLIKNNYLSQNTNQQAMCNFASNDEEVNISSYNTVGNTDKEIIFDDKEDELDKNENETNNDEHKPNMINESIPDQHELLQCLNQKQKSHFQEIKSSIQNFMKEYSTVYHQNIFHKFKVQSKKLMEEKFKKYSEVSESYFGQIKEVEFILDAEDDLERQTPLKLIIESLKEEQQHELELIEDQYEDLYENCYTSYKNQAKTNNGIQLLEEKLRLEIYNQINNIVNPKKV